MISLRNLAEPVTLVRSPTLTKGISGVSVNGSSPDEPQTAAAAPELRAAPCLRTASAIARDVLGRGAAAAADDVDQPGCGELAEQLGHVLRALVVAAELVRQAGVRIGADERVGDAASSAIWARISSAPSAQLRPTENGAAWRTEFQNAAGVWPESVRPERSVMVPEIMTGTRSPRSSHDFVIAKIAALALSVSKMVSISSRSAPPSIRPRTCSP